jgi:predicted DNA-binding transcriptional regulator YafY
MYFCEAARTQTSRPLSVLMLLQARGRLRAQVLAAEFEVSVHTIHRDIDPLSAAGISVFAEHGRGGSLQLRAGWHTRLSG